MYEHKRWIWWPWGIGLIVTPQAAALTIYQMRTGGTSQPGLLLGYALLFAMSVLMVREHVIINSTGITLGRTFTTSFSDWSRVKDVVYGPAPEVMGRLASSLFLANRSSALAWRGATPSGRGDAWMKRQIIVPKGQEDVLRRAIPRRLLPR